MLNRKFKWDFWTSVTLIIALIFTLFLIYPLFSLFISGFKDPITNEWSLTNFVRFFSRKYYYQGLLNSFKVTSCVTVLAIVIGVPMAYFMSAYKVKLKGLVEVLIIISMLSP
ncbi:MAG: iron ABC transporter permease, partial [Fusobacterium mortiferum]